jgi:hypothetical protein
MRALPSAPRHLRFSIDLHGCPSFGSDSPKSQNTFRADSPSIGQFTRWRFLINRRIRACLPASYSLDSKRVAPLPSSNAILMCIRHIVVGWASVVSCPSRVVSHLIHLRSSTNRKIAPPVRGLAVRLSQTLSGLEDAMMVPEEIFRSCCRNFIRFSTCLKAGFAN